MSRGGSATTGRAAPQGRAARLAAAALALAACAETFDGDRIHGTRFAIDAHGNVRADERPLPGREALAARVRAIAAGMEQEPWVEEAPPGGPASPREWLRVAIDPAAPFRVVWPFLDVCMGRSHSEEPIWKLLVSSGDAKDRPLCLSRIRGRVTICLPAPTCTWRIEYGADGLTHVLLDEEGAEIRRVREAGALEPAVAGRRIGGLQCADEAPWWAVEQALAVLRASGHSRWPEPLGGDPLFAEHIEALGLKSAGR